MRRRVCEMEHNGCVSLPAEVLQQLNLAPDCEVDVLVDPENGRIILEPIAC